MLEIFDIMSKINPSLMKETVSGFMSSDFAVLRYDHTVKEAIEGLRKKSFCEKIIYFYAVDESNKLIGVVPVRKLLSCKETLTIEKIMVSPVHSIKENSSLLYASETLMKHKLMALPVVDTSGVIVGVIDINLFTDEIKDFSKKDEQEKAFQLIGVDITASRKMSAWSRFSDRFPWLLSNIASGVMCAIIASRYELLIQEIVIIALFMTVVLALSESVSIQSMTITLQNLQHSRVSWAKVSRLFRREISTAILLGVTSGLILFSVSFIWRSELFASLVILSSVIASICMAGLLGVGIPSLVYALKLDPKVAAGPIVLAMVDVCTLVFYFNIAGIIF